MARLLTHHDRYHRHAILGLVSLLHFAYRLLATAVTGVAFPPGEPAWATALCLLPHTLLHVTSLTLHLPRKRNFSAPMIWPEFRLHSGVFGLRMVAATAASLWLWAPGAGSQHPAAYLLVLGTCCLADLVTRHFGDQEQRTTNAMPYPAQATAAHVAAAKEFYRDAQVNATLLAATGPPSGIFLSLLSIQAAPLLMTLVRKGVAVSTDYHRYYGLALLVPYWAHVRATLVAIRAGQPVDGLAHLAAFSLFYVGRFRFRLNKYLLWTAALLLHAMLHERLDPYTASPPVAKAMLCAATIFALKNSWYLRWIWKRHQPHPKAHTLAAAPAATIDGPPQMLDEIDQVPATDPNDFKRD